MGGVASQVSAERHRREPGAPGQESRTNGEEQRLAYNDMVIIILVTLAEVFMKQIAAAQFKAQCLAIMDRVQQSGEPVVITKHGKPVVQLVPAQKNEDDIFGYMIGKARIVGDVMNTVPLKVWNL
jgi:prevent-host-death family protein